MNLTQKLDDSPTNPDRLNSTEKPPWYIRVILNPVTYSTPSGPVTVGNGWGKALNPERLRMEGIPIPKNLLVEGYTVNPYTGKIS